MIDIRPPQNAAEVRDLEHLSMAIWGKVMIPHNLLHAWMHTGGIVLGAFDGEKAVGFCAGFQGTVDGKRVHWSHAAGVLPAYQRQRIGYQLKMEQRLSVLAQGIETIAWTFDPLRKNNATFNLNLLGGIVRKLNIEIYGEMRDEINAGLLTDRFEVHWQLKRLKPPVKITDEVFPYILRVNGLEPQIYPFEDAPVLALEIPADLETLRKNNLAKSWYYAVRETAIPLFEANYHIEQVISKTPDTFAYIFRQEEIWYLYVVETADGSLYSGITNHLDQRIAAHNAGKGAKYTAVRRPVKLRAAWKTYGRANASRMENAFKKLSRSQKLAYIEDRTAKFIEMTRFI